MYPYLIRFGDGGLSTYAVMNVLGYLLGVWIAIRTGRRWGVDKKRLVDLTFWLLIAAIIGARLGYLLEQAPFYFGVCQEMAGPRPPECEDFWRMWRGGFVFYGGFLLALATAALLVRRYKLPFWDTVDAVAPALAAAHALGRLGCFFGGCCFGAVCHSPLAVRFPEESFAGSLPRHATQLYEAGAELIILFVLLTLARRRRFGGQLLAAWMFLYGGARFLIEVVRGDAERGYLTEFQVPALQELLRLPEGHPPFLSWAQVVSLALIVAGATLWLRGRSRATVAPSTSTTSTSATTTPDDESPEATP